MKKKKVKFHYTYQYHCFEYERNCRNFCNCFKISYTYFIFSDIPASMWRLLSNPIYVVTCLGSCMELSIVNGFLVFLPKYLETQFSIGKSQASIFTGNYCFIYNYIFFMNFIFIFKKCCMIDLLSCMNADARYTFICYL